MDVREALQWLEERGGTWSVRATSAVCIVVVSVRAARITVPVSHFSGQGVGDALVGAVQQLREKCAA